MTACPCCSNAMLRHIRRHQVYWFCRSCWQEMPLPERPSLGVSLSLIPPSLEQHLVTSGVKRRIVAL